MLNHGVGQLTPRPPQSERVRHRVHRANCLTILPPPAGPSQPCCAIYPRHPPATVGTFVILLRMHDASAEPPWFASVCACAVAARRAIGVVTNRRLRRVLVG